MQGYDNGITDDFGIIYVEGSRNTISANHISYSISSKYLKYQSGKDSLPVIINLVSGIGNYINNNHIVATDVNEGDKELQDISACFNTQVDAILGAMQLDKMQVIALKIDEKSFNNTVIYTAREDEIRANTNKNAFVFLPSFS